MTQITIQETRIYQSDKDDAQAAKTEAENGTLKPVRIQSNTTCTPMPMPRPAPALAVTPSKPAE